MKHEFRLVRAVTIGKRELKAGDLVAVVETPEGVPLEKAVGAIVNGHATEHAPAAAPVAPATKGKQAPG